LCTSRDIKGTTIAKTCVMDIAEHPKVDDTSVKPHQPEKIRRPFISPRFHQNSIDTNLNLLETDSRLKPENNNTFKFSARYADINSSPIEDNGLFVIQQYNQADL